MATFAQLATLREGEVSLGSACSPTPLGSLGGAAPGGESSNVIDEGSRRRGEGWGRRRGEEKEGAAALCSETRSPHRRDGNKCET